MVCTPAFLELPGPGCHGLAMTGFSFGLIPLCKVCAAGLVNVEFEDFALRRFHGFAGSSPTGSSPKGGALGEWFCLIDAKETSCSIQVAAIRTVAVGYWLTWSGGLVVPRSRNWAGFRGHHGEI